MIFKIGWGMLLLIGLLGGTAYVVTGMAGFIVYNVVVIAGEFLASRNAVKKYDKLREKGVDFDELVKELKKIDKGIDVYFDLFWLVIDLPRGVDKNMVLQYVPDGVRVRVKRKYLPF